MISRKYVIVIHILLSGILFGCDRVVEQDITVDLSHYTQEIALFSGDDCTGQLYHPIHVHTSKNIDASSKSLHIFKTSYTTNFVTSHINNLSLCIGDKNSWKQIWYGKYNSKNKKITINCERNNDKNNISCEKVSNT